VKPMTDSVKNAQITRLTPRGRPFEKGNPGRPRGSRNRFTNLRKAFLVAFEEIGGQEALARWARQSKNKGEFYRMLARMLPREPEMSGRGGETWRNMEVSDDERAARIEQILESARERRDRQDD